MAENVKTGEVEYELYYYNTRGLVEPARYMLARSGVSWRDNRAPVTTFDPITPLPPHIKSKCPYGQVPLLEWDGQQLSQSNTIARFLARKFNLVGADDLEAARCDEIVDASRDFYNAYTPLYFLGKDLKKREEVKNKAVISSKERYLSQFNSILEANKPKGGGAHLVGTGLTWADIYVSHFISQAQRLFGADFNLAQDHPYLDKLLQAVFSDPGIKKWVETRPETAY